MGHLRSGPWDHRHGPGQAPVPPQRHGAVRPLPILFCGALSQRQPHVHCDRVHLSPDTSGPLLSTAEEPLVLRADAQSARPQDVPRLARWPPALWTLHSWLPRCFLSPSHLRWTLGCSLSACLLTEVARSHGRGHLLHACRSQIYKASLSQVHNPQGPL